MLAQQLKQAGIRDQGDLYDLGQPRPQVVARDRAQKGRLHQNVFRRIKRTKSALFHSEIHRALDADGGIDLPDQGGRHPDMGNAPPYPGRCDRDQIAANPAADGDQNGFAVELKAVILRADIFHRL